MSTSIAIDQLVVRALGEAVSRIAKKVSEGKRLSDREVVVLVMSLMMRRFEDFNVKVALVKNPRPFIVVEDVVKGPSPVPDPMT
jgi:hypothetical protein